MKVSVSILSSTIKPEAIVKNLDKTDADYIHLDIMDGKFVENKTWTYGEVKKIISYSNKKLDVHLMVKNPEKFIEDYAMLNTESLAFHYEAVKDVKKMIELVKNYGLKVGIAINPDTKEDVIFEYLGDIDYVLVMSVYPGKSGQTFIEDSVEKIRNIKSEIEKNNLSTLISVDGGINEETANSCKEAGVDILVSASYLHNNLEENIKTLKNM